MSAANVAEAIRPAASPAVRSRPAIPADTAMFHPAGALARPVPTLLARISRYPTSQLFWQKKPDERAPVIQRAAERLPDVRHDCC